MRIILFIILQIATVQLFGQYAEDERIYKDTRVINLQSVETIAKGKLDFRIGHKFGDAAGTSGGWGSFYGLENASDVLFAFDYGISDNLMIGIGRAKGSSTFSQNIYGQIKYNLIKQSKSNGKPVSMTVHGMMVASTMPNTNEIFEKTIHRFSYHLQYIVARKFGNRISAQLNAAWTFRNLVSSDDKNDLASIGGSLKFQLSKAMAIITEVSNTFKDNSSGLADLTPALGFGLEWETGGGHVFQMNFTNAKGILETDFVTDTTSQWGDGEFRLGFTISRLFTIK